MQLSNVQTLGGLKHGRVVIDVLNEDCHWQVRCAAVPAVTRQPEPKQILVLLFTIFYYTALAVDMMYVVIKGDEHKVCSFL